MKFDYDYKITFKLNEPFDINRIKSVCNQYPNSKILIEVQNTKGISSSLIRQLVSNIAIRIAGAYDEDRLTRYSDLKFRKETTEDYYYNSVIYTKNETIKILEEIEKIESGISRNWSDIQKILYVYDRLKTGIMYDPKFEKKFSSEIRSLRGLITKQTVCAGYAVIFKEFMDRNNIECEFVRGGTKSDRIGGHAWNIVNIDGKKYPIDLTLDNALFRSGQSRSFDGLGKDITTFCKKHYPAPGEKTQDYEHTLSQIDPELINQMYKIIGIGRARDYRSTTYYGTRKDGSRFMVAQTGDSTINNTNYYRYYYCEISKDGKRQLPLILYSDSNLTLFINHKNFGHPKREDCKSKEEYSQKIKHFVEINNQIDGVVKNILFSRENIADSISKKTFYIGGVKIKKDGNNTELVSSYQEIAKPEEIRNLFVYPMRRFTRSDGSVLIVQQIFKTPQKINGIDVMKYEIFEMINENGKQVLKRNTVFTERNLFKDTRQSMVDDYLSRKRLDRKVGEAGGYIGYYDENGIRTYNPDLVKFFETSKKVDLDLLSRKIQQINTPRTNIPTFSELKALALKYEVFKDSKDPFDPDTSKIKVRDIKTGKIQTDQSIIDRAMFANMWLTSAGIKYYQNESRPGEIYAFNESAEELYNLICKQLLSSFKKKGIIDIDDLLRNIKNNSYYKYSGTIIDRLFRSPYQTEIIKKLFFQSLGINEKSKKINLGANQQTQEQKPIYSSNITSEIAFGNQNHTTIIR